MRDLTTTLLFLRRDDSVLLAMKKTGHGKGHWNGVGGKLEAGETLEQAAVRECQEEIGVTPQRFEKMAELDFFELYKGEPVRNMCHTYVCSKWHGEPGESDEMAPRWFTVTDIPYGQMWPDDIHWLPQILAGRKLHGVFRYDDDNMPKSQEIEIVEIFA